MEKISEQILNEIKQRRLSPRPRWQFYLLNGLWWLSAGLMIVCGGLALALVFNSFSTNDWSWAEYAGGWLSLALSSLPWLWVVAGIGLVILGDYNLIHTKKAYRWGSGYVLLVVFLLSVLLAFGLERFGLAEDLDEAISKNLPEFLLAPVDKACFWHKPDHGLLMGLVVDLNQGSLTLKDTQGKLWLVETDEQTVMPRLDQEIGAKIKIFGLFDATDGRFKAKIIKICLPARFGCPSERKKHHWRIIMQRAPQEEFNN